MSVVKYLLYDAGTNRAELYFPSVIAKIHLSELINTRKLISYFYDKKVYIFFLLLLFLYGSLAQNIDAITYHEYICVFNIFQ